MSQTEIINEEPVVNTKTQSKEDQFFGKTTEINSEVDDTLEVEIIDDTPEEDRRPKNLKNQMKKLIMIL